MNIAYFKNPDTTLYVGCKMIGLTLKHGICAESVYSFIQYAAIICHRSRDSSEILEACRIGKIATSLMKRFSSPEMVPKIFACYFGFVAIHTEPLHVCVNNLRTGFDGKRIIFCSFTISLPKRVFTVTRSIHPDCQLHYLEQVLWILPSTVQSFWCGMLY